MKTLIKSSGISLILGGFFFAIPNTIILPFVDFGAPFSELLQSTSFFYRMIIAALTVMFLLYGSVAVYLDQVEVDRVKRFRIISFLLAFFGSAFMLANEWHQIFVLPEISKLNTALVNSIGSSDPTSLYSIGAMIALSFFSLGWILFCISLLLSKKLKAVGPILVIVGFLILPFISSLTTTTIGGITGGITLGLGFYLIGTEVIRPKKPSH